MADITLVISGDASGAGAALKKVASGAREAGLNVEEAGKKADKSGDVTAKSMFKAAVAYKLVAKAAQFLIGFVRDGIDQVIKEEKAVEEWRKAMGLAADTSLRLGRELAGVKEAQVALSKEVATAGLEFFAWITGYKSAAEYVAELKGGLEGLTEFFSAEGRHQRDSAARANTLRILDEQRAEAVNDLAAAQKANDIADGFFFASGVTRANERIRLIDIAREAQLKLKEAGNQAVVDQAVKRKETETAVAYTSPEAKKAREEAKRAHDDALKEEEKYQKLLQAERDEGREREIAEQRQFDDEVEREWIARYKEEERLREDNEKKAIESFKRMAEEAIAQQERFRDAGVTVGTAFVNGLDSMIQAMGAGQEFDIAEAMIGIIQTAVAAVFSAIPFLAPFAGLASAGVGLIGHAAEAAFKDPYDREKGYGYAHNGAWANDLPRYHSGGSAYDEVPAMLLRGERVLSNSEVDRMGGHAAVDGMARGGGGIGTTVNINAFDPKSFQDRLGSDMGSSFSRVIRQNRGELSAIFRRLGAK